MTARAMVRSRRPSRFSIGIACLAALAALWLALASRVHVNASWSDGAWGYLALPLVGAPGVGDAVLFEPPGALRSPVPYMKIVRGLPGDRVALGEGRTVTVGGVALGRAKSHALDGRALEAIAPGTVPPGHYYLHGEHADSHDSRYAEIGLVPRARILGRALALPDLPWLGLEGPLVGPQDAGFDAVPEIAPGRLRAGAAP